MCLVLCVLVCACGNVVCGGRPLIGNGYVGTTVGGTDTYMAGVFKGFANVSPSHRARLQSNLAITVTNANVTACALDVRRATYYRRSAADGATVEQRWYAHRVNRSLLVMELQVVLNEGVTSAVLQLATNAGPSTSDFTFTTVTSGKSMSGNALPLFAVVTVLATRHRSYAPRHQWKHCACGRGWVATPHRLCRQHRGAQVHPGYSVDDAVLCSRVPFVAGHTTASDRRRCDC